MTLVSKIAVLANLGEDAQKWMREHLVELSFKKGDRVIQDGKVCNHLYFVKEGALCGYYHTDAKDICNWIALKDDFATSYYSFISQKPSFETIECVENATLQAITYKHVNELYKLFPATERAGRLILEEYYLRLEERIISIQFTSAKERYEQLFNLRPEIFLHAPLGRIASYLGMSQETLSRIRSGG